MLSTPARHVVLSISLIIASVASAFAQSTAATATASGGSTGGPFGLAVHPSRPNETTSEGASGFTIVSADGEERLRIGGYLQTDARFFGSGSGHTGPTTFLLRRVRPILEGYLYHLVYFRIMPDFGLGATVLQDAYAELRFSRPLHLRAGKFKEPFSLERLQSAVDLPFVERSVANNLEPNRDIGFQFSGDVLNGELTYAAGLFNGVYDGGSSDADAGSGKDLALRLFARPFENRTHTVLHGLGFGIAETSGSRSESLAGLSFKTAGRGTFFRFDPAVNGSGYQRRISPQIDYFHGPVGFMGAYVDSRQKVSKAATTGELDFRGWFVSGSWVLTGEDASYEGVRPSHSLIPGTPGRGAVEIAARYSAVELGSNAFALGFADPTASASSAHAATLGLNWYLNRNTKLQWNFERTDFNRAIKIGGAKTDHEDAVLGRLQVSF